MITRKSVCPICRGSGEVVDKKTSATRLCAVCKSSGSINVEVVNKKKRKPPQKYIGWEKIRAAIIEYQKEYLDTHDVMKLRPMRLMDIGKIVGAHISNICIRVKGKSINGIPVRELFTNEVSGMSNKAVMHVLKQVAYEYPSYNDSQLKEKLSTLGINISIRTIAKYRKELGIVTRDFFYKSKSYATRKI